MPTPLHDDVQAWVAARDEAAARRIVAELHPRVAGIIRRHSFRTSEWADLEQDVFVRIFKALPTWRAEGPPLEHWVSRIALNVCRQRWRSESRRPEWRWSDLSEGERKAFLAAARADDPLTGIEARDARTLLYKLLESMPAEDRLILSLLHLEGLSLAEIARLTGINRLVVKVRAFRARQRLRAAVRALGEPAV
jgi:RNA polymerase sigma-70 factor (ECF subfamily)